MSSSLTLVLVLILMCVYAEGKSCNGLANYTLRFQGEWTRERHPNFPRGAHFSPMIGCSHNSGYVMWKAGIKATKELNAWQKQVGGIRKHNFSRKNFTSWNQPGLRCL